MATCKTIFRYLCMGIAVVVIGMVGALHIQAADKTVGATDWQQIVQHNVNWQPMEMQVNMAVEMPVVGNGYGQLNVRMDVKGNITGVVDAHFFGVVNEHISVPMWGEKKGNLYSFYYKVPQMYGGKWVTFTVPVLNIMDKKQMNVAVDWQSVSDVMQIEPNVYRLVLGPSYFAKVLQKVQQTQGMMAMQVDKIAFLQQQMQNIQIVMYVRVDPVTKHIVHIEGDLTPFVQLIVMQAPNLGYKTNIPLAGYNLISQIAANCRVRFFADYREGKKESIIVPKAVKKVAVPLSPSNPLYK